MRQPLEPCAEGCPGCEACEVQRHDWRGELRQRLVQLLTGPTSGARATALVERLCSRGEVEVVDELLSIANWARAFQQEETK